MKIEIYEQAGYSSEASDFDLLLDYAIKLLERDGNEVIRYEKNVEPEKFEFIKGYKLPVIVADGEILCAGSYDLRLITRNCPGGSCQSCPSKGICNHETV